MSVPGSSFQPSAAGRRFQLLSVKRAPRSISRQHPSQILSPISRPITHPRVKDLPFSAPSSSCLPAEFNMCRLIGCDEIRCWGRDCVVESRPPWSMKVLLREVRDAHVLCIRFNVHNNSHVRPIHVRCAPYVWPKSKGFIATRQQLIVRKSSHSERISAFSSCHAPGLSSWFYCDTQQPRRF